MGGFNIREFLHLQKFGMTYFVLVWVNVVLIQARLLNTPKTQWCNCTSHEQLTRKHSTSSWPVSDSAIASRGGGTWPHCCDSWTPQKCTEVEEIFWEDWELPLKDIRFLFWALSTRCQNLCYQYMLSRQGQCLSYHC